MKIPLAGDILGRRILVVLEDAFVQLTDQLKTSRFAVQVDEATNVVTDGNLIIYVAYAMENDIKENVLFCKPTDDRAASLEVLNVINHFLHEKEMKRENFIGLCTDETQSMSGWNAEFQTLIRKKAPYMNKRYASQIRH